MPPDSSPPVGNSYFWESRRINHIFLAWKRRRVGPVSFSGGGAAQAQRVSRAGHRAPGTGHDRVGSAASHLPSRPGLWLWVLDSDLPPWPQPLDGRSVLGRWDLDPPWRGQRALSSHLPGGNGGIAALAPSTALALLGAAGSSGCD